MFLPSFHGFSSLFVYHHSPPTTSNPKSQLMVSIQMHLKKLPHLHLLLLLPCFHPVSIAVLSCFLSVQINPIPSTPLVTNDFQEIASSPPTNVFEELVPSPSSSSSSATCSISMPGKKVPYDVFINHRKRCLPCFILFSDCSRVVKNIVNRVLKVIKNVPFVVAKHPVGVDEAVLDFERATLQSGESHRTVQIVRIWGMGGSGKTTLAKQFYNNKYKNMEKSSFLLDIRDADSKSALHKKQQKLVGDLGLHGVSIENIEEGKGILASRLRSVQVLIVQDDVDNIDQMDALVPDKYSLGEGSLIVVT